MIGTTFTPSLLDGKFLLLLLFLAGIRWIWPNRHFALFGAIGSIVVIGLAAPATLLGIVAVTLGFLYPLHRIAWAARSGYLPSWVSRAVMPVGISGLVFLLIVPKVYRHFTLPFWENAWIGPELAGLIGFSYFVFRAISFLHIQSILPINESRPWALLFYTLFPSTLTSGPIQKFQDFRQQLTTPVPLSQSLLLSAAYRITRGYFRKVVIAFILNEWVTRLLAVQAPTIWISVLTIVALYLYFYFDFAGYSDIAIGLGLLLGIKVPENFRKPFSATTVSEFWRNWHITLVDWFRDNVFIPLGGMQTSRYRAGALALLVMVLCGLWHGLTFSFLIWGVWHGFALYIEAVTGTKPIPPALRHGVYYWWRVFWTNARVAVAGLLFLPDPANIIRTLSGLANWRL